MTIYLLLYALSVCAMNPWGSEPGAIWTTPKIGVLIAILLVNGFVILRHARVQGAVGRAWRRALYLWGALLGIGLVSSLLSPAPRRSFLGQSVLADGWFFWLLVAGLLLTNALVLRLKPEALRPQLLGLLLGGTLFALSIFPQLFDDSLDYTVTAGQRSAANVELLLSGLHVQHQPVGFSSHRGHASVVTALTLLLALVSLMKRWLSPWLSWPALTVASAALWFTDSRGGLLAALLGLLYLGGYTLTRRQGRRLFGIILGALLLSGGGYVLLQREADIQVREFPSLDVGLSALTSSRSEIWPQALWAVRQRPLLGYGFDGFGTAWPSIEAQTNPAIREVLGVGDATFTYSDGARVRVGDIPNFYDKAHNVVLDWLLALGIPGFLVYASLLVFLLVVTARSAAAPLEALTVAYIGFTLTWYDSAQFAYLGFWGLSVGLAFRQMVAHEARAGHSAHVLSP